MESSNKASSNCWWWDIQSFPPNSGWLQNSLKDLDLKTNAILMLIQEGEESLVHGADTSSCKKRKELIKMVEDLRMFCRSLAQTWVRDSNNTMTSQFNSSLSWNPFKRLRDLHSTRKAKESNSNPEFSIDDPEIESSSLHSNGHFSSRKSCVLEIEPDHPIGRITEEIEGIDLDAHRNGHVNKQDSHDLRSRVMKLMEENLKLQEELIKRNEEKREAIRALCSELHQMSEENRILQSCLKRSGNQSQLSRVKSIFHVNLWR